LATWGKLRQQVCVQLPTPAKTWHCPHSLLSADRAAIDRYLLTAGPTAPDDGTDRRTDRRTRGSFTNPALRAVANKACFGNDSRDQEVVDAALYSFP